MTYDDPPSHVLPQSLPARLLAALRPGQRWFALVVFALALVLGLVISATWLHTRTAQPAPAATGAAIASDPTHPPLPTPMPGALSTMPPAAQPTPGAAYIASNSGEAEPEAANTTTPGSTPAAQASTASPADATPAESDSEALVIDRSQPDYPIDSLNAHEEGEVRLQVSLDALGNVEDVRIENSSGSRRLDRAAMESVRSWHFRPAYRAGAAVSSMIDVPVDFHIDEH
jgi:TonB family protein